MADTFLISHSHETGRYQVWEWNPDEPENSLVKVEGIDEEATLGAGYRVTWVGNYLLCWDPPTYLNSGDEETYFDFVLFEFNPYRGGVGKIVQMGSWTWSKFAGGYVFNDLPQTSEGTNTVFDLILEGAGGYIISQIPTAGRSTFRVFNFDAYVDQAGAAQDPIATTMGPEDAFPNVGPDDQLLAYQNVVLVVNRNTNQYTTYSFDPQAPNPLSYPPLPGGEIPIELGEKIVIVGEQLITWTPGQREHLICDIEGTNPFANPRKGRLPEDFPMDAAMHMTAVHPTTAIDPEEAKVGGTLAYMRSQIEHVIYYVLESRSFDNVLGWLYENTSPSHWVGVPTTEQTCKGASTTNSNTATANGQSVTRNQFQYPSYTAGSSVKYDQPMDDPFHGTPDSIHQQWSLGYPAYQRGDASDMLGFLQNTADNSVMGSYTTSQLSVLSGLATNYAVSDYWFCSEAGGTTTNRATLASGSAFNITADYESGEAYANFPNNPHRQSMWKVLANHGHTDWAIYYSVDWLGYPYTYHLYLEGQLPSVDEYPGDYVQPIRSFFDALANGNLPKFSFLEPIWYLPDAPFTSYHPTGDVLPGEAALLKIFNAVMNSSYWEKTALVISFSKGGGLYDHEPAQPMLRAWPNDGVDGYGFDTTGARVPTIVVSPLVQPGTVFRSDIPGVPFDHTSLPATILSWFGIPRTQWSMGERIAHAPTFESVFTLTTPRTDKPSLSRAEDAKYSSTTKIPIVAPTPVDRTWNASGSYSCWTAYQSWVARPESDCASVPSSQKDACEQALPTQVATFGTSTNTTVTFGFNDPQIVDQISFSAGAPAYTFVFDEQQPSSPTLTIAGSDDPTTAGGVANNSTSTQTFQINASNTSASQVQLNFINRASASTGTGAVVYQVGPSIYQVPETTGTVSNAQSGGIVAFNQRATASNATFKVSVGPRPIAGYATVGAEVRFMDHSTASQATFEVSGTTGPDGDTFGNVVFHNYATADSATFTNKGGTVAGGDGGNTQFYENAKAGTATITNEGATGGTAGDNNQANGGDVAFDGTSSADHATINNYAAKSEYGYGGVTSFNNNRPYMARFSGASAGNAVIYNHGARYDTTKNIDEKGGGGHTEFTGIYGAGTAGNAQIHNYGASNDASTAGAGYTRFSVNGWWPKAAPTAGNATISNHPATVASGKPGTTTFEYQNYEVQKYHPDAWDRSYGPTAGQATIYNYGGDYFSKAGGVTTFDHASDAGESILWAAAGTGGGGPGQIVFKKLADGKQSRIDLSTGGMLDLSASTRTSISFGTMSLGSCTIALAGASLPMQVSGSVSVAASATVTFTYTGTVTAGQSYTLITAASMTVGAGATFRGAPSGFTGQYTPTATGLTVTFAAKT